MCVCVVSLVSREAKFSVRTVEDLQRNPAKTPKKIRPRETRTRVYCRQCGGILSQEHRRKTRGNGKSSTLGVT